MPGPERRRAWLWPVVALVLLAASVDERFLGAVTDEQQMLSTAFSMGRFGELGIARGQYFSVHRRAGDAVSVYGLGLSFAEMPLTWIAGPWERAFGARTSQTLFALLQIVVLVAAATAARRLARLTGAGRAGEAVAFAGTLASPLWASAGALYSEPLQCALLAGAAACAAGAIRDASRANRLAAAAGFLAGAAVLTKPLNLVCAPFLMAPLLLDAPPPGASTPRRARLVLSGALGAVAPLLVWLASELVRFGRPLSSYSGQAFTHPVLDGLFRLTLGVNKGLLWYFPLVVVSVAGLVRLARREETRGTALAIAGTAGTLLVVSSAWWAWDGTVGWGPRLLLPAIPLLAAAAGAALRADAARRERLLAVAAVVLGVAVNALGVLESEAVSYTYVLDSGGVPATPEQVAAFPPMFLEKDSAGRPTISRVYLAASDAAFSPIRTHAFLLATRLGSSMPGERMRKLESPPWLASHPDAVPRFAAPPNTSDWVRENALGADPRWPHLGAVLLASEDDRRREFLGAYDVVLADQIGRNLDLARPERALPLARELHALSPSAYSAALLAEALRASGRLDECEALLASRSPLERRSPFLEIVEALVLRDRGRGEDARALLASAARAVRTDEMRRALAADPRSWPGLRGFLSGLLAKSERLEKPGARWAG